MLNLIKGLFNAVCMFVHLYDKHIPACVISVAY